VQELDKMNYHRISCWSEDYQFIEFTKKVGGSIIVGSEYLLQY